MSAPVIVFVPFGLFAIVALLCFVGCKFEHGVLAPPFTQYSDTTVLADPAVVAYWPLGESDDGLLAADRTPNPNSGKYIDPATLPAIYPWPAVSLANPPNPNIESAAAPGTVAFAQTGIVPGDTIQPASDPAFRTPCLVVNGCY